MVATILGRAPGTLPSNTEVNSNEFFKAITTRTRIQLPEIHVKRSVRDKEKIPSTDEKHVEQTEQTIDISITESSGTPQVKAIVPIKSNEPLLPFSHRLQKHKLDK
ncbi:Uncharacterized protein Adt_31368 [Abeliophyllum distichum]|uniref:Uncharacterized protein n=1 Tax=Abeliophyllum distichum TaxID=126358 RepID=A0ABD1RDX7_9LAMI